MANVFREDWAVGPQTRDGDWPVVCGATGELIALATERHYAALIAALPKFISTAVNADKFTDCLAEFEGDGAALCSNMRYT